MRRFSLKWFSLALAGLAPTVALAGNPEVCATCAGQMKTKAKATHVGHHKVQGAATRNLCSSCASKLALASNQPVEVASSGTCSACSVAIGPAPAGMPASAPGYASVGDAAPTLTLGSGGTPGYASVGGPVPTAEPAPIGVMRTDYQAAAMPGAPGAGLARPHGAAPGMANIPYAKPSEVPPSYYAPQNSRHHVMARVLGVPQFGRRRAEAEMRAREAHAQISYGNGPAPTELPASMVYGGGSR